MKEAAKERKDHKAKNEGSKFRLCDLCVLLRLSVCSLCSFAAISAARVVHDIFPDLEFIASEINEQRMLLAARLQISKDLRNVFVCDMPHRFQLDYQAILNQQISDVFTEQSGVLVVNI